MAMTHDADLDLEKGQTCFISLDVQQRPSVCRHLFPDTTLATTRLTLGNTKMVVEFLCMYNLTKVNVLQSILKVSTPLCHPRIARAEHKQRQRVRPPQPTSSLALCETGG